jgi:hypothetical protein
MSCGLRSYRTGNETGKDNGKDGCVNEEFHRVVTSGYGTFLFDMEDGNK